MRLKATYNTCPYKCQARLHVLVAARVCQRDLSIATSNKKLLVARSY